jgi:hypothetical protein
MRPPARAVRATSGEDLRLSMMPQRRSIDEESTLPELLGCLQHGGATLPTIDFWRPLDNKSRAAQRGLGTARNGANRVEVRVRAQISIKYEFIRSHGGRPRVRTQLTMMTPQGMRVVAFRPDHRSRPIRASTERLFRNELRDVAAVLATCEQEDWYCAKWALRLSRPPKASCTIPPRVR